ncbi:MAG TPA: ANTAR domain-containing protein [Alphaproteobacteria bacterium]|nr:ANTAR domain-containing protein [Alphaproteobacteria bacterium]
MARRDASTPRTPNFRDWRAAVLHPPGPVAEALQRQLARLSIQTRILWPDLDAAGAEADVVFFDADLGHDQQFPWPAGGAPMPTVALVGSEAPGRLEWALAQRPCAHMTKPVGSGGVYSALVIASHAFAERRALQQDIAALSARLKGRTVVARALARLMAERGLDDAAAMRLLRGEAMDRGRTLEDQASALLAGPEAAARDRGGRRP